MQVYIGGAYNGKRAYVRKLLVEQQVQWIECADYKELPKANAQTIVLAGVEAFVEHHLHSPEEQVIEDFMKLLHTYRAQSDVFVIVTENGRGIVPILAETRELRDRCGRLCQQIFKEATTVTRIWYGLTESLK